MSNSTFGKVFLKPGKERALERRHPWVFSGAIAYFENKPAEGDWVEIYSSSKNYIATGYFSQGSIALRIVSFEPITDINKWFRNKAENALNLREFSGITAMPDTDVFRLIFAEGDGVPGLIADKYANTIVMQCHTMGIYRHREAFAEILSEVFSVANIYDKSAETLKGFQVKNEYLKGGKTENVVSEYGNQFYIDWEEGQKTGFFIDQRENRKRVADFSEGKKVLNVFCYTGGFSIYALNAGAREVHSVDISAKAMELTDKNASLSEFPERHLSFTADVFDYLKQMPADYDIVVLDPPAFAKSKNVTHNAMMAYKRINAMAMKKMKPGSLLFTFSCSQNISLQIFTDAVRAAAIECGRNIKIIERLSQPADHPVNVFHPEGEYLKGLILFIE
jgi:23S rRNA (cytosine1962-C5)-methyltransferase